MKRITLSSAKKKAWSMFSKYIRTYYATKGDGWLHCYTCGKQMLIKEAQAGHGIPGRSNAVLFLEEVVKPQCPGCNIWGRGQLAVFTRKLIDELGIAEYDNVSRLSGQVIKFTVNDYLDIYEKYKQKLEEL